MVEAFEVGVDVFPEQDMVAIVDCVELFGGEDGSAVLDELEDEKVGIVIVGNGDLVGISEGKRALFFESLKGVFQELEHSGRVGHVERVVTARVFDSHFLPRFRKELGLLCQRRSGWSI